MAKKRSEFTIFDGVNYQYISGWMRFVEHLPTKVVKMMMFI